MVADGFDALLTFDKNLQHQQNFSRYTITVFVLNAPINTYGELTKLSSKINEYLGQNNIPTRPILIKSD